MFQQIFAFSRSFSGGPLLFPAMDVGCHDLQHDLSMCLYLKHFEIFFPVLFDARNAVRKDGLDLSV
jgi:hypothetical protein